MYIRVSIILIISIFVFVSKYTKHGRRYTKHEDFVYQLANSILYCVSTYRTLNYLNQFKFNYGKHSNGAFECGTLLSLNYTFMYSSSFSIIHYARPIICGFIISCQEHRKLVHGA